MAFITFQYDKEEGHFQIKINKSKFEASTIGEFKMELNKSWPENVSKVSIDCSEINFIDSSGIGAFLSIQKRLKSSGEKIRILNPQKNVLNVIELLRLNSIFNITETSPVS